MTETSEASEVEKVIGACEARLAAPEEWKPFPGYPDSLALSVLDSIWSINARSRDHEGGYRAVPSAATVARES